ncbi:lipocalin family protein [Flavobacterium cellulosilyticum]|uniref:Lipocalin-like domain-containing protein n=1 Tax=Flavobacterium cellulosilyticum TaxID=2541731 RepID=A0A4R5CMJ3_9FLAO|nr:lipocalin family protein [Flavobacterium cellulosilyticum]TDD98752.1 hypothetical protein E0F76_06390 [Flavobacterium cellulosilyticum]
MKKIKLLFVTVLVLSVFFSSCTKDEGPVDMALVIGKWNFNKTSFTQGVITTAESEYSGNEAGCSKDYIEIKSGGVAKAGDYTSGCVLSQQEGTWVANGNSLKVTVTGSSLGGDFQVVSVTNTEMVLKITTVQSGITITVNQTFTKA